MTRVVSVGYCVPPDSYPDGYYYVACFYAEGGFTIEDGRVICCSPCLRLRFEYYLAQAVLLFDLRGLPV